MPVSSSDRLLLEKATLVMKNAYCPYSKFSVGAALLTDDGAIYAGANNENASYGLTICAERSAMCSALAQGHRKFEAIAIVTNLGDPASPCGACRQFLIEFGDIRVILGSTTSDKVQSLRLKELLPMAFTPASLDDFAAQTSAS